MITKAVIPAAGFGTRFLPATKASPKEMLPIVDTPVIQYVVEEAVASGITEAASTLVVGLRARLGLVFGVAKAALVGTFVAVVALTGPQIYAQLSGYYMVHASLATCSRSAPCCCSRGMVVSPTIGVVRTRPVAGQWRSGDSGL